MGNPFTDRAIRQAKGLRELVIKMNDYDRAEEAKEDEEEAQVQAKKDSTDYPAKQLEKFNEEDADEEVADWAPDDTKEEILFLCDRILYKLMSQADDKWISDTDYIERTQLKLKEVMKPPMRRKHKNRYGQVFKGLAPIEEKPSKMEQIVEEMLEEVNLKKKRRKKLERLTRKLSK